MSSASRTRILNQMRRDEGTLEARDPDIVYSQEEGAEEIEEIIDSVEVNEIDLNPDNEQLDLDSFRRNLKERWTNTDMFLENYKNT